MPLPLIFFPLIYSYMKLIIGKFFGIWTLRIPARTLTHFRLFDFTSYNKPVVMKDFFQNFNVWSFNWNGCRIFCACNLGQVHKITCVGFPYTIECVNYISTCYVANSVILCLIYLMMVGELHRLLALYGEHCD